MMHRLRRYDVFRFAQNDVARFTRNDAMFAPMCPQAHIIRRSRHHWRSQHHLPQANIIQKDLFCQVDKRGLFVGAGYGNRTRLRGLGSHYNSRYTNPASCGYYSKQASKIQPLFVAQ